MPYGMSTTLYVPDEKIFYNTWHVHFCFMSKIKLHIT
jgi:hypothetical protein